jgi:2-polyprenyl-3-methyl-5-hydroxy-6-metoxy-1,4-benzoquinol methylase
MALSITTDTKEYSEYLERKYLPGRRLYLHWFFYPKICRNFSPADTVIDLGCGTGEFLHFCRKRKRSVLGVDSNESLVHRNLESGFEVVFDDICELTKLKGRQFNYAVCDNVLEHLEVSQIRKFFLRAAELVTHGGLLVCIVPGVKGFQKDPTHKTYISEKILADACESSSWAIKSRYYHPFNCRGVDRFLYLNMQVFEMHRR